LRKKVLSSNKKNYFDYEIIEKLEVGILLYGCEVKSSKQANLSLVGSIIKFSNGEAFIENAFISPYEWASSNIINYDARRKRKLLMHKSEINKLSTKVKEKGFAVVPLEIYIGNNGKIKLLVGFAKGRKLYNKKEYLKKKDIARELIKEY
jgi:SsrA-binding protein